MQLNEVIEENSLATISKRTRISVENIERLVQRDFGSMKRVKALGFISILEREFGIELDGLRQECIEYFRPYPEEEFDAKLVVTVPESNEHSGGYLSKILMLLVLFAVGYGAWYFFTNNKNSFQDSNTSVHADTSFIATIVGQAKAWLGDSSSLEKNTSDGTQPAKGVWAESDTASPQEGFIEEKPEARSTEEAPVEEKNDTALEEQIIREVKAEQQDLLTKKQEENRTDALTIEGLIGADELTIKELPAEEPAQEMLAVEVPSMVNETKVNEIVSASEKVQKQPQEKKEPKQKPKKIDKRKLVILHPTKKVWVGYTNLETMKRAAKVIEKDIEFDTGSGSWILVAGHNAFNFVIRGKTITPKKREKNYFLIKNGKVKSISQKEFQKLNKSTVW